MMKGLKRLAGGGMLLMELRGVRKELARLADTQEALLGILHQWYAQQYPISLQPDPTQPAVEIAHVNDEDQRLFMDVELRLTAAKGQPPTEDEILAEFDRLRGSGAGSRPEP
jgi:hypothetical protein